MSKGSSRRPAQVSEAHVRAEYERIFAKGPLDDTSTNDACLALLNEMKAWQALGAESFWRTEDSLDTPQDG